MSPQLLTIERNRVVNTQNQNKRSKVQKKICLMFVFSIEK